MSSTIQILALRSASNFDDPTTPDGRQWKKALTHLATNSRFFTAFWGRHIEDREQVTLFIDWNWNSTAQTFLIQHYDSFVALLAPLLACAPDLPHITDLSPNGLEPASLPGSDGLLTTISKLTYSSWSASQRTHLLSEFSCYIQDLGHSAAAEENLEAEEIEYMGGPAAPPPKEVVASGWKGGSAAWVIDNGTIREPPKTCLWMMMSWKSLEAEAYCEKTLQTANGKNMKEVYLGRMLKEANPERKVYHVAWEMVTKDIAAWWMESENPVWPYQPLKEQLSREQPLE